MVTKINSELLEDKVKTETIKRIEKKPVQVLEEIVIGETFFFFGKTRNQSDRKIKEERDK